MSVVKLSWFISVFQLLSMTVMLVDKCRRQQYIGKAKFIEYIAAGHSVPRIVVGTEQNVIAAISGHSGHIGEMAFLLLCLLTTQIICIYVQEICYFYCFCCLIVMF